MAPVHSYTSSTPLVLHYQVDLAIYMDVNFHKYIASNVSNSHENSSNHIMNLVGGARMAVPAMLK